MKTLRLMKISLPARCSILKRIVIALGAWEMIALALGSYSIGAQEFQNSIIYFVSMIVSYVISYELSYTVSAMIIRLEIQRSKEK
jgi:hypothetical protein